MQQKCQVSELYSKFEDAPESSAHCVANALATVMSGANSLQLQLARSEERIAEALAALQDAKLRRLPRRELDHLEEAYLAEVAMYEAAFKNVPLL